MCQAAHLVLVAEIASSYASMYSSQCPRSATSAGENFQCFSGFSSLSRNRFRCSSLETLRKNLRIKVPLRPRCRSKLLMSS